MTPRLLICTLLALAFCEASNAQQAPTEVRHVETDLIISDSSLLPEHGILTTGQPDAAVLDAIADAGYVAVIDFRGVDEDRGIDERDAVESRGLRYVSIPVTGDAAVNYENAALLDQALGEIEGPVLLHCASGNRAAAILALREKQNGAHSDAALELGLEAGLTGHRDLVEERLAEF